MSTEQHKPTGSMPSHQQTILLVDDEAAILALLSDVLEDAGYNVLTASNGRAALALAYQQRLDLVVTDLMMPHMDGMALCAALRADAETAQIPVLGMSAGVVSAPSDLFNGFVAKPFNLEDVLAQIRHILSAA